MVYAAAWGVLVMLGRGVSRRPPEPPASHAVGTQAGGRAPSKRAAGAGCTCRQPHDSISAVCAHHCPLGPVWGRRAVVTGCSRRVRPDQPASASPPPPPPPPPASLLRPTDRPANSQQPTVAPAVRGGGVWGDRRKGSSWVPPNSHVDFCKRPHRMSV